MNQSTPPCSTETRPRESTLQGWLMVFVAALAMVATLPGRTHGLGMITERLLSDPLLNLSRAGYGQMNFWATLLGAFFCLGIGSCIDRLGIRGALALVMLALGGTVLAMSHVSSLSSLFLAILLTRGFGQSALSVVSIAIVGKWFDRNSSWPMAVYSVLIAAGFIAAALAGKHCADWDWRHFWSLLGWAVLGLALILSVIARDRRPTETIGLNELSEPSELCDPVPDMTHAEALRTPMFWVCSLSISLYGMIVAGISLFNESILVDRGFPRELYYESLAIGSGIGVVAKLGAGLLGNYWPVNRLLSLALFLLSGSLLWLARLASYQDVMGYIVLNAVAGGMLTVLFFSVWPVLYGRRHLGRIQGSAQMLTVLASALGPWIFAHTRELTGSYTPLLWFLAGGVTLTAIIAWRTPLPRKTTFASGDY